MNNEYNSVVVIEDAQTKIKELVNDAMNNLRPFKQVKKNVQEVIDKCAERLVDAGHEELVDKTKISLINQYLSLKSIVLSTLAKSVIGKQTIKILTSKNPIKKDNLVIINLDKKEKIILPVDGQDMRKYLTSHEGGAEQLLIDDYNKKTKSAMINIANERATFRDKLGRKMSIRNLSEMTVRYDEQLQSFNNLTKKGIKYVIASQHMNASKRCEIWQGKIFVLDADPNKEQIKGKYVEGYKPSPIAKYDGQQVYSLRDAMNHGFLGYNCRHRVVQYKKGMDIPKPIPAQTIRKERAVEQNMRNMESQIRKAKELQYLDKDNRDEWIKKSVSLQRHYNSYARRNKMPIEVWRTRVTLVERNIKKTNPLI